MRALLLVALLACNTTKETKMADWNPMDNDPALAQQKITALATTNPAQYGQSLLVTPTPGSGGTISNLAKDLVRWRGKSGSDVQPLRIYLSPWQPQPSLVPTPITFTYAQPTPWQEPVPSQFDQMAFGQIFARVNFGGGGVQHQAYVDWPPRGLLFQVATNYVQIDAVGTFITPGGSDPTLPRLLAHVAPEPGGGDSVQPGTFTYLPIDFNPDPGNPPVVFQVPPFARAFRPIINQSFALNTGIAGYQITELGSQTGNVLNVWVIDTANVDSFNTSDYPISGSGRIIQIGALSGIPPAPGAITTINVGCIFLLDL